MNARKRFLNLICLLCILLTGCGSQPVDTLNAQPLDTPRVEPTLVCNNPQSWVIRYNRSGGFAGFDESLTLDSGGSLVVKSKRPATNFEKIISENQRNRITTLLAEACPFKLKADDMSCNDCFIYDLDIAMDGNKYSIQATDITLTDELNSLTNTLDELLQNTGE